MAGKRSFDKISKGKNVEREPESSEDELDKVSSEESEDELDNVEEDNEEEDNEEVNEDGTDSKRLKLEDGKKTSKEQHAEQRKLLKERKLNRSSGIEIQKIKELWEKLRTKNPPIPKELKIKLCNEIWSLSKNVIADLVLKHDSSRVVQTLIKHSNKSIRLEIAKELKGHYFDLARSPYGKYLLIKLLHYGSKEVREIVINELHGNLRKLLRHREGAYVIEDLYVLYSNEEQKNLMIKEFWGSRFAIFKDENNKSIQDVIKDNNELKGIISGNLIQTITTAVEKGSTGFQLLHAVMREYIKIATDSEFESFIDLLSDQIAELVHTAEGCEVACTIIAKSNAKQRKIIIKNLKPHLKKLITNEYGNLVVLIIFLTVDDTVLVYKTFNGEIDAEQLSKFSIDKFARRPFLYLLNGLDGKYFNPLVKKQIDHYMELSKKTSKKSQETRRGELLKRFNPIFYEAIIKYNGIMFGENIGIQFANEVLLHSVKDDSLKDDRLNAIDAIISSLKGDINNDDHLINKLFTSRFLKSLIQKGTWNFKKQVIEIDNDEYLGDEFALKLITEIINVESIEKFIQSKNGSFVVLAIYELLKQNKDEESKKFVKSVKGFKKILKKIDESNKGAKLLLKLIEN